MNPVIKLTTEERTEAVRLGLLKHTKSESDGRCADWYNGTEAHVHADGVGAEMAHCKFLGVPFEFRMDTFKRADVGKNTEVRSTKQTWFGLKVKDRDKDARIVAAWRQLDDFTYVGLGWLTVADAKKVGEKKDPGNRGVPAYFVTDSKLNSMRTFPRNQ